MPRNSSFLIVKERDFNMTITCMNVSRPKCNVGIDCFICFDRCLGLMRSMCDDHDSPRLFIIISGYRTIFCEIKAFQRFEKASPLATASICAKSVSNSGFGFFVSLVSP
eukprot:294192_1